MATIKKTRWTNTSKKERVKIMKALAIKKQSLLSVEEKHAHAVKMCAYRWGKR